MAAKDVEFSFDEAVRTMGVTPERLENLIAEGKIVAVDDGRGIRIRRQAILEYMASVSAVAIRQQRATKTRS
jgi:excisionase family DNA binding protein